MIELIGFEKEYSDLLKRYKSNNLPNSILIHGLSGIGKRTFLNKLVKNILNIEFKNNQIALKTYENMSKNGLISTLIQGNIIRLTPPLIVSSGEIRKAIKIITQSL